MQQNYSTHAINSPYKLINVCANAPTQSSLNPEHCHHIIQNRVCYIALHSSLTDRESHFPSSTQFTYISYIYKNSEFQNVSKCFNPCLPPQTCCLHAFGTWARDTFHNSSGSQGTQTNPCQFQQGCIFKQVRFHLSLKRQPVQCGESM